MKTFVNNREVKIVGKVEDMVMVKDRETGATSLTSEKKITFASAKGFEEVEDGK